MHNLLARLAQEGGEPLPRCTWEHVVLAGIGLWPDPNPNPIGPGLLAFFTFWPAVACIAVGVVLVRLARRR